MNATPDLAAFCRAQWPRLVGTLHLYCGDLGVAEELAQDTLERVCRRWDQVQAMQAPGPWVNRVAINLANSAYRRRSAARRAAARLGAPDALDTASSEVTDDNVTLQAALARLPERQRTALVLRYYADLDPEEAGEAMGCSGQAVRNLTHRAVVTLRSMLVDLPEEVGDVV